MDAEIKVLITGGAGYVASALLEDLRSVSNLLEIGSSDKCRLKIAEIRLIDIIPPPKGAPNSSSRFTPKFVKVGFSDSNSVFFTQAFYV